VRLAAAGAADGLYEAVEVLWEDSADDWADIPGGRTWGGDASDALPELVEASRATGLEAAGGIYEAFIPPLADGLRWVFVASGAAESGFWARLGAASPIGDNRWVYPWERVGYQSAGTFKTEPTSPTSGSAYNTIEAGNTLTGVQGNGVDTSAGPDLAPIGPGAVVYLRPVIDCDDLSLRYVFEVANHVGPCP
jgi:hypothetical protein